MAGSHRSIAADRSHLENSAGTSLLYRKTGKGQQKDLVFSEYCREYKRHFSWIKAGKISEEEFAVWAKQAKAKKHECDAEKISLDEFKQWLKK